MLDEQYSSCHHENGNPACKLTASPGDLLVCGFPQRRETVAMASLTHKRHQEGQRSKITCHERTAFNTNNIFVMAETDPATSSLEARAPEYEALQDAFERLHDTICPEGVIVTLFSRHLLSKVEADTIRSKATTHEKNEELLFAIFRRSPAQVLQFCQFLLEKQSHCGNILKEGES